MRRLAGLARPSIIGAVYMLLVATWTANRAASDQRLLGVEAADVTRAITIAFADRVRDGLTQVLAVSVLFGLALGASAGALVVLRARLGGGTTFGLPLALRTTPVLLVLHAATIAWGMATRPQLYTDAFYAMGGWRRLLQVFATDVLGPRGVIGLVVLASLAYLLGPPRQTRPRVMLIRRALVARWRVVSAIAVASLVLVGLENVLPRPRTRTSTRPNVIVIAADSLRPDRIVPAVAPRLAALAADSATFDASYTSLPRTFPAWVTRLTGQYPHHHGFRNMFPSREIRARPLDALPARLAAAGYATSVAADYAGDVFPRAAFGFERVDTPTFHFGELVRQRMLEPQIGLWPVLASSLGRLVTPSVRGMNRAPDADDVASRTLAAIDAAGDRPFFHVAFFSTAHFPYAAPWPGYARFTKPSYRGRFKYDKANVLGREAPPDDADIEQVRALYDGAIATIDDAAGRVLDGLARRGLDRNTIVIVTADHGETLFEAGRGHGHGDHLFGDEALHVPLVVHDGRAPARRHVTGFARDVDLAPTVYEMTGVLPPAGLDGTSLVASLATGATGIDAAFAETGLWFTEDAVAADLRIPYPDVSKMLEVRREDGDDVVLQERWRALTTMAKHRAILTKDHELVLAPTRGGLRTLLYDRVRDPSCLVDLAAKEPEIAAKLRGRLLTWVLEDHDVELAGEHLVWRHRREVSNDGSQVVRLEDAR